MMMRRKERLTRSTLRRLDKQNTHISSINSSSQNSVIVITSDNETNDVGEENMSHTIIEYSNTNTFSPQQQELQNKTLFFSGRKSKRPSVIFLDDDLSFVQSSNAKKSFNEENIGNEYFLNIFFTIFINGLRN